MSDLRYVPIFRALHRPNLVLGAEREPVLFLAVLCVGVAMTALTITAAGVCGIVWVLLVAPLRMMAKADPLMSRVYMRSLRYQRYYPARSRPWRED